MSGKTKSRLRFGVGMWPDSPTPAQDHVGLTGAARHLAESVLEDLGKLGIAVTLDETGRAHFRATRAIPPAAKLAIERHGDLIEPYLIERAPRLDRLGLGC